MVGSILIVAGHLTPDHSRVLVKIMTTRQAEFLLTDTTIFWVVKPRLFAGSFSGLGTLLSERMSACFRARPREAADSASYTRQLPMVAYFSGSVQGLGPGSEVTVHGIRVGHVTDVRLAFDPAKHTVVVPVHFEVQSERVVGVGSKSTRRLRRLSMPWSSRGCEHHFRAPA
jgi:paraquat-inducible protein B